MATYPVNTIQNMQDLTVQESIVDGDLAVPSGYYVIDDWGLPVDVYYEYVAASSATHNWGTIISPIDAPSTGRWIMRIGSGANQTDIDELSVLQFGMKRDGSYADPGWSGWIHRNDWRGRKCADVAMTTGLKRVYVPNGLYIVKGAIFLLTPGWSGVNHSGIHIRGQAIKETTEQRGKPSYIPLLPDELFPMAVRVADEDPNNATIIKANENVSFEVIDNGGDSNRRSMLTVERGGGDNRGTFTDDIAIENFILNGNNSNGANVGIGHRLQVRGNIAVGKKMIARNIIAHDVDNGCSWFSDNTFAANILTYDTVNKGIQGEVSAYSAGRLYSELVNIEVHHVSGTDTSGGGINVINEGTNLCKLRDIKIMFVSGNIMKTSALHLIFRNVYGLGGKFHGTWTTDGPGTLDFDNVHYEYIYRAGLRILFPSKVEGERHKFGRVYMNNCNLAEPKSSDGSPQSDMVNVILTESDADLVVSKDFDKEQPESATIRSNSKVAHFISLNNQERVKVIGTGTAIYSSRVNHPVTDGLVVTSSKPYIGPSHTNRNISGSDKFVPENQIIGGGVVSGSFTNVPDSLSEPAFISPGAGETGVSINPSITWGSVSGAVNYIIVISKGADFLTNPASSEVVYAKKVDSNSLDLAHNDFNYFMEFVEGDYKFSLEHSTEYFMRVHAVNGTTSISPWSDVRTFTTGAAAFQAPALVSPDNTATGISVNPLLRWNKSTGATHYGVEVSKNSNLSSPVVNESNIGDVDEYQLSNLDFNSTYYWRITAYDGVNSEGSAIWSFTTVIAELPDKPVLTEPRNGTTGIGASVDFSWSDVAPEYRLKIYQNSNFETPVYNELLEESDVAVQLSEGNRYDWEVIAINSAGETPSDRYTFWTGQPAALLLIESVVTLGDWTVVNAEDAIEAIASIPIDVDKYIITDVVDGDPARFKLTSIDVSMPSVPQDISKEIQFRNRGDNLLRVTIYQNNDPQDIVKEVEIGEQDYFDFAQFFFGEDGENIVDILDLYVEFAYTSWGS
jgi:hypothetical protein